MRNKVVVITGAAAGVGRACALRFARAGASLGLIARDKVPLEELSAELVQQGAAAVEYAWIDVSDAEAVENAARRFENDLGPIDIWLNDAMVTVFSPVHALTAAEYRRVTEVTYLGVVHGAMAALKLMRPRNGGQIINIGSALAYRGIPLQAAYCGAKHAIRGFTASLRSELEAEGSKISVSIIELPAMNTPQFDWARTRMPREPKPMGTIYQPEVAAEAVFRAARHRPREYWVGFSTALTIVGNILLPNLMDRYLADTAVEGQETDVKVDADRRDNLNAPVSSLHRTHGRFDSLAKRKGVVLSGSWARVAVVAAGAAACFCAGRMLSGGKR